MTMVMMNHMPSGRRIVLAVLEAFGTVNAGAQVALKPIRTFPQFAGTWALDEAASTGNLNMAPRVPLRMTIAITPTELTVTKQLRLLPNDRASVAPLTETY